MSSTCRTYGRSTTCTPPPSRRTCRCSPRTSWSTTSASTTGTCPAYLISFSSASPGTSTWRTPPSSSSRPRTPPTSTTPPTPDRCSAVARYAATPREDLRQRAAELFAILGFECFDETADLGTDVGVKRGGGFAAGVGQDDA